VKEEECLDEILQEIDEVIVPADVGEFMGEDGFQLRGGEAGENACGHEHHGRKPADDRRRSEGGRNEKAHGAGDFQGGGKFRETHLPRPIDHRNGAANPTAHTQPAHQKARGEEEDARGPQRHRPWELRAETLAQRNGG
jgi:hypothetical protein